MKSYIRIVSQVTMSFQRSNSLILTFYCYRIRFRNKLFFTRDIVNTCKEKRFPRFKKKKKKELQLEPLALTEFFYDNLLLKMNICHFIPYLEGSLSLKL